MAISFIGSTTGTGTINGGNATITLPTNVSGDVVYVFATLGTTATTTITATTSVGAETFTPIGTQTNSSNVRFSVLRRVLTAARTQAIITGTGTNTDTTTGVAFVYRGVNTLNPEDATPTYTTGSGTTPDSPSITVVTSNTAIVTCFAAGVVDTAVTQPSSFLSPGSATASDTNPTSVWASYIIYNSTAAFDPAAWSGLTSATWVSATVAVRQISTAFTSFKMSPDVEQDVVAEARRVVVRSYDHAPD